MFSLETEADVTGAEESEFQLFWGGEEIHGPGAKLVSSKGWVCGLEVDITSSVIFTVFCLKVGKKYEKYDLIKFCEIFFFTSCSSTLFFYFYYCSIFIFWLFCRIETDKQNIHENMSDKAKPKCY